MATIPSVNDLRNSRQNVSLVDEKKGNQHEFRDLVDLQSNNINNIENGKYDKFPDINTNSSKLNLGIPEKGPVNILNVSQRPEKSQASARPDLIKNDDEVGLGGDRAEDLNVNEPVFTLADLREISSGVYNVGELKIKKDGTLDKINNHVHGRFRENNVKLTPEENLKVRQQVCKRLTSGEYEGNRHIGTVRELLLNERDRTSSLSRDEVAFLFKMLDGAEGDYTVENFKKLHDFKVGNRTDVADVQAFIGGLNTTRKDKNDVSVQNIVKAVSVNAQQSIVQTVLHDILNFIKGLFKGGFVKAKNVDDELGKRGKRVYVDESRTVTKKYHNDFTDTDEISRSNAENLINEFKENYRFPRNIELPKNTVAGEDFSQKCKTDICTKLQKKLGNAVNKTKVDKLLAAVKTATDAQKRALKNINYASLGEVIDYSTPEEIDSLVLDNVSVANKDNNMLQVTFRYCTNSKHKYLLDLSKDGHWTAGNHKKTPKIQKKN